MQHVMPLILNVDSKALQTHDSVTNVAPSHCRVTEAQALTFYAI